MTTLPAGWKPISSAPKDGTPVLLFARHVDATASTRVVGSFHNNGFGWIAQCYVGQPFARLVPSHWMDLPAFPDAPTPPATTQDDPITVSLDPDPRGISVGVWQGSHCIYNGAHAVPVAQGDAKDERQADACPRCGGGGEITVMSDNSPDAHDVDVCCDHCQGSGAAVDAAKFLAAALSGEKYRHMQLWAEYRNFHRSLCTRFGYGHDEVHFRRDLVSLEEAIAAKVTAPAAGDARAVDPLQGAADWLVQAHSQSGPTVLSACLMIGYNRAQRLYDAAIADRQGKGGEA
ncbi:hypothetical protein LMG26858_06174 [Achromobacter anxifer]|uniref:DUF551 domain-containing protein n=1 Tax=Achromobacter anxifer TaxID=1287737 RepID=A0A6S7EY02_9BURK|nr:hypothetical protein [Achromobacter anxifer]CAB3928207.1 hypothetical protein LMG26858_06174 [Achromobacter anxifer]